MRWSACREAHTISAKRVRGRVTTGARATLVSKTLGAAPRASGSAKNKNRQRRCEKEIANKSNGNDRRRQLFVAEGFEDSVAAPLRRLTHANG